MNARTTRIVQVAGVILALLLGTATATALAKHGEDDGPGGTTGTTQTTGTTDTTGTTTTGTTGTTTTPAPAPRAGIRVSLVGIVTARDEAAGTFALKVRGHKHHGGTSHHGKSRAKARSAHSRKIRTKTWTVRAATLPAVGAQVQVKGRKLADGTIEATRVKTLGRCARDVASTSRRGSDDRCGDDRGRGRGGDDDRGGKRGGDDRGRGDDDRGDDDRGGRGRGGDDRDDDDRGGRGRGGDD